MAVVYLAKQPVLGRSVALKELAPFLAGDPALAERFIREARVAGSLNHPNVVTVLDFLEQDGVPYIAMEYLERGSLRPFVGRMSLAQVAGVLEGLLAALSHAEVSRIVHRDVKPENLLITGDGGVKIADFGIAKAVQKVATEEMLTPAGATVGTPAYMAPEQAMAQEIGPWTDLYQTGVVAYELLTGEVPYRTEGAPIAVLMKHITDPVPDAPRGHRPRARGVGEAVDGQGAGRPPGQRPRGLERARGDHRRVRGSAVAPRRAPRRARADRRAPDAAHPGPLLVVAGVQPRPTGTPAPPPPPPTPTSGYVDYAPRAPTPSRPPWRPAAARAERRRRSPAPPGRRRALRVARAGAARAGRARARRAGPGRGEPAPGFYD